MNEGSGAGGAAPEIGARRVRTVRRRPPPADGAPSVRDAAAVAREERHPAPALRLLNVGYGNLVATGRIVSIVSSQSAPMRRLREEAASRGKLVDATQGRRTRSILVTDSDHVVLSALNPETIAARLAAGLHGDEA